MRGLKGEQPFRWAEICLKMTFSRAKEFPVRLERFGKKPGTKRIETKARRGKGGMETSTFFSLLRTIIS